VYCLARWAIQLAGQPARRGGYWPTDMITLVITGVILSINIGLTAAQSCDNCDTSNSSGLSHQAFIKAEEDGTPSQNAVQNTSTAKSMPLGERKQTLTEVSWTKTVQLNIKLVLLARWAIQLAGQPARRGGIMADRMITLVITGVILSINSGIGILGIALERI